jgi:hypothetical protein
MVKVLGATSVLKITEGFHLNLIHAFMIIIWGYYPRLITQTWILTELSLFVNLQKSIFKTTEGIYLKLHTCLQCQNMRSISRALDMDINRFMTFCDHIKYFIKVNLQNYRRILNDIQPIVNIKVFGQYSRLLTMSCSFLKLSCTYGYKCPHPC